MSKGKFTLSKGSNGQFYFNLKAPNGEIIGRSEGYTTKQGALNGIDAVRQNSQFDSQYHLFQGRDSQYYFNLRAANNQIILQSEGYASKQGAMNGIASVKRYAPTAELTDLTAVSA